jgi:hypothetical protein
VDQLSYKLLYCDAIDQTTDPVALDTLTGCISCRPGLVKKVLRFYWATSHIRISKQKRDELKLC